MGIYTQIATGRAMCKMCDEKIVKGDIDVVAWSYQSEKHHHYTCVQKSVRETKKQAKKLKGE